MDKFQLKELRVLNLQRINKEIEDLEEGREIVQTETELKKLRGKDNLTHLIVYEGLYKYNIAVFKKCSETQNFESKLILARDPTVAENLEQPKSLGGRLPGTRLECSRQVLQDAHWSTVSLAKMTKLLNFADKGNVKDAYLENLDTLQLTLNLDDSVRISTNLNSNTFAIRLRSLDHKFTFFHFFKCFSWNSNVRCLRILISLPIKLTF